MNTIAKFVKRKRKEAGLTQHAYDYGINQDPEIRYIKG